MSEVPESARHEVKFVAPPLDYARVESWIRMHPAGFHSPYPPRRVNNVYFDNHDLFAFDENLVGASRRTKVRLRWYGNTWTPDRCTLEVKRRRNALGWKLSYRVGGFDFTATRWAELRADLRRQLPAEARVWLDANPCPVLINRYHRQYFESGDRRVRVTLDRDPEVYSQLETSRPNTTRRANLPATIIVECKFDWRDRRLGNAVIQGLPLRASRNSKYVIGVQSMGS